MKLILIVGIGSFLGGILRYVLSLFVQSKFPSHFPFGTLSVNLIGCLIIGIVLSCSERSIMSSDWKLFLATGICGGFTTYSAFSGETFSMLREGQYGPAGAYIVASVALGVLFTFLGYLLARLI
jgi:CrcB protein